VTLIIDRAKFLCCSQVSRAILAGRQAASADKQNGWRAEPCTTLIEICDFQFDSDRRVS
jgi:hypothetical protein